MEPGQDIVSLEFVNRLRLAMSKLTLNVYVALLKAGYREDSDEFASGISKMYIKQFDYTQDFCGFVMFLELKELIEELGELIGMKRATTFNQMYTCVQYSTQNTLK